MRAGAQTSMHLLLAVITTVFSGVLNLVTVMMGWELWMVPLMAAGCLCVWVLHIARLGPPPLYEGLCAGLLLLEYFFFSIHETSLFDIPAMTGILVFALFMLNRKWILYTAVSLYGTALLYHWLILRTISLSLPPRELLRLGLGMAVVLGGTLLARYWINRRIVQRQWYENVFAELDTVGKQNAVFLSNVSHELRTPINMVIGISEVALGKDPPPEIQPDLMSIEMAGKRLSSQINNMLDYTEIVSGTLIPAKGE